jgi:hypothetical protein
MGHQKNILLPNTSILARFSGTSLLTALAPQLSEVKFKRSTTATPTTTPILKTHQKQSQLSQIANYYLLIFAAVIVVVVSFAVPLLLAEVFPWRNLLKQRNAKLSVTTKSFKGKTVLITGANGAFGSQAAKIVADLDVDTLILLDVRDCAGVKADILAASTTTNKPNILVWQVDMMSYASCQEFAKKARGLKSLDHVLITAGILSFNRRESPEGWETCEYPP